MQVVLRIDIVGASRQARRMRSRLWFALCM